MLCLLFQTPANNREILKYVVFYISQCPGPCLSPDIFETSSRLFPRCHPYILFIRSRSCGHLYHEKLSCYVCRERGIAFLHKQDLYSDLQALFLAVNSEKSRRLDELIYSQYLQMRHNLLRILRPADQTADLTTHFCNQRSDAIASFHSGLKRIRLSLRCSPADPLDCCRAEAHRVDLERATFQILHGIWVGEKMDSPLLTLKSSLSRKRSVRDGQYSYLAPLNPTNRESQTNVQGAIPRNRLCWPSSGPDARIAQI